MFLLLQYSTPHGHTFLSQNLPGLFPSFDTTLRLLKETDDFEFGFTKAPFELLRECLHRAGSERLVIVSEDCTANLQVAEYRESNDSIYGVCPKNDQELKDGAWKLKFLNEWVLRGLEQKIASGELSLTSQVMVYVATPMERSTPSVILAVFPAVAGSLKNGVLRERWAELKKIARSFGITVLGHASDAVPSSLLAMKISIKDPSLQRTIRRFLKTNIRLNFGSQNGKCCIYFQDMLHQATKARCLLRNPNYVLKIGTKHINIHDLELLLTVPAMTEQSLGLRRADLKIEDKMNYPAMERMMSLKVEQALKDIIPDSALSSTHTHCCLQLR